MPKRPPGEVRLDESERALIAAWRAAVAYTTERTRPDLSLEEPRGDEVVSLEVYTDGSGFLRVEVVDAPGEPSRVAMFGTLAGAAAAIDRERVALEAARLEREETHPRYGDPRRGRPRGARKS